MQAEPGTSTDSHIEVSSGRPVTPAANSNGGEALPRPALDNSDNGGSVPAPLTSGEPVATPAYVYAIGRIEPRFPTLSAEKEFAQATGRGETAGLSDRRALQAVLSQRENRYLVRQLCWVLTIENLDTYILHPRDPADVDLLVAAVRPMPRPTDADVVVGVRGPIAPPELCNGLMVPIVVFDQIYSFDVDTLVKSIPRPKEIAAKDFAGVAEELFYRIMQLADNAGATDEHRAVNYLAVRYPAIYATAAEAFARNDSLSAVDVRPSPLSGTRRIMEVIFSFTNRQTDVTEKFFTRVDVTEEFPFLVTKISPYYDR
jgi:PatG C-terminal